MKEKSTITNFSQANLGLGDQKGMTLVELLIALVVIVISFLAISAGQMSSFTSLDKSVEIKNAKTFATRILENKYQDLVYNVLNPGVGETRQSEFDKYIACVKKDFAAIQGNDTEKGCYGIDTYKDYDVKWRLYNELDNGEIPIDLEGIVLLEIKVDWTDNGEAHSFSLTNYLSCVYVVTNNSNICPTPRDPV